jgi:hypothetical protein
MPNFSTSAIPGEGSGPTFSSTPIPGEASATIRFNGADIGNVLGNDRLQLSGGFMNVTWKGFLEVATVGGRQVELWDNVRNEVCQKLAVDMQAWARANAPWEDRTGDARAGLKGVFVPNTGPHQSAAMIYHTVPYGKYLEVMGGGSFAIILPTLLHFAAQLGKYEVEAGHEFASHGDVLASVGVLPS